jgi:hypothetical protein
MLYKGFSRRGALRGALARLAVVGLVFVIGAVAAAPAMACPFICFLPGPGVVAPANGVLGNGGQSTNNAPAPSLKRCLPNNNGTLTAEAPSAAILPVEGCFLP